MPVHIRVVPYADIAADIKDITNRRDASYSSSRSQRFNTAGHHLSEIQSIFPEMPTFIHETPSWIPYGYTLWLPLIASSQGMKEGDYFVGKIPSFLWEDLMRCHSSWYFSGKIGKTVLDEVLESLVSTKAGKQVAPLFDSQRKWFIRLDQMSPKDSPLGGKFPCTTLEEVVLRICSSMRAYGCLQREMEDAKKEGRDMDIKLVVNKWDDKMDIGREFRVFVPPPLARLPDHTLDSVGIEDLRISAISQYRWTSIFQQPYNDTDLDTTAKRVYAGAQQVFRQMLEFARGEINEDVRRMLIRYGFSFDITVKEGGEVQLVEINPFGALSGCGACLFNWVKDARLLYGLAGESVEIAVTL